MSQALSPPRKVALVLLPCIAAALGLILWEYFFLRSATLTEDYRRVANQVLAAMALLGVGLGFGFVQRLRRQLRTRSRYLLWTAAALYFLAAMGLVLRFEGWAPGPVVVSVAALVMFGIALWGAMAERQRTIEYTLFPRKPRKQSERPNPAAKQGA